MLKKGDTIKKNFKFEDNKYYVTVFLDMPMGDGNGEDLGEISIIDVVYTAPPFKSATGGAVRPQANSKPAGGAQRKATVKQAARNEDEEESKSTGIPKELGPDEIKDPDVQRNLWSLLYCQKQQEYYDSLVKKALKNKKPVDQEHQAKLLVFQSQAMSMESAITNEQVTQEQYIGYLEKGLAHDRILLRYFENIGDDDKASRVKKRIECYEMELNGDAEGDEEESDE